MILSKKQSKHGTGGRIMAEYIERELLLTLLERYFGNTRVERKEVTI